MGHDDNAVLEARRMIQAQEKSKEMLKPSAEAILQVVVTDQRLMKYLAAHLLPYLDQAAMDRALVQQFYTADVELTEEEVPEVSALSVIKLPDNHPVQPSGVMFYLKLADPSDDEEQSTARWVPTDVFEHLGVPRNIQDRLSASDIVSGKMYFISFANSPARMVEEGA